MVVLIKVASDPSAKFEYKTGADMTERDDKIQGVVPSKRRTSGEDDYYKQLGEFILASRRDPLRQFFDFAKYVPRQYVSGFLARYELYKTIMNVPGSIVECGVFHGQGLMSFAQFSAIVEPVHYKRKIIGFDTFEGFTDVSGKDTKGSDLSYVNQHKAGGLRADSFGELHEAIRLYDMNRFLGHIPKVELVKGDIRETLPKYLENNPHLVVALLYLDMDLYEPTATALEALVDRVPRGGVLAFDELNDKAWPGETLAVLEKLGLKNLRLQRFPFDSNACYAIVE